MRLVGAAFVAGMLGVLIGSLAAQAPREDQLGGFDDDVIFEGPVQVTVMEQPGDRTLNGNARISEGWVIMTEAGILIPREQVRMVRRDAEADRGGPAREDFGTEPGETPPARKLFRED